ncbi:scarecrow-like protein 6 isoform X1 [Populus alba x Populus x berolinensis]|uniref:Scarecrow-like protein 6 isoform X1 n=1 Tax=Populus alba x Populus x berolinensis TaxID=444605 RepID=A0AAD6RES6_9ROSI|nr:scarecrow-like protein 6 isoform X1 [Populus alba x Populus x berolinensis]
MKAIPLPFEDFQAKGLLGFSSSSSSSPDPLHQHHHKWQNNNRKESCGFLVGSAEPTSVLDTISRQSPPTSSSTLSSSQGGGGGGGGASTDTTNGAAGDCGSSPSGDEKCGPQLGMEDWESVLSGSPSQEQSILRLIMGDIEDPSLGLNKLLQSGSRSQDMELNASGFGAVDQVFGFEVPNMSTASAHLAINHNNFDPSSIHGINLMPGLFNQHLQQAAFDQDEKPQILNPGAMINQNQHQFVQNPAMLLPLSYAQLEEHHNNLPSLSPPPLKRLNAGPVGANHVPKVFDLRPPELFLPPQQQQNHQFQMTQQQRQGMITKQEIASDELANQQQLQQAIINPICQAAELIETGNPVLAQGILARLNHQLSVPIGKPYQRTAFYFKEALQLLLNMNNNNSIGTACNLIFKIGAYKSFSEISPILQFASFTCNQALLEAFEGFERIHVVDFDIGYGGQWASLMQELALRNGGAPSLKITAFASPSSHDELELGFTQENLKIFAREINMPFEIEILSLESLSSGSWPMSLRLTEKEVIAVNLPVGSFSNYPSTLPLVLRFVKQLLPKVVVSLDRGCDRSDLPFAHHVNHAIQSYTSLLESLDAVNVNLDSVQKIERFLVQPSIEKAVLGRHSCPDRTPPWRSLFLQYGFTPLTFSNFTESQAEYLVQRTPVRGFHVEKRQSSLVLCWQQKDLVSASAWRC